MSDIPKIYERISLIMSEMSAVGKDSTNKAQGWNYRAIDDIKNTSNPLFTKHQVFYTPKVLEHSIQEQITSKGTKMSLHIVKMNYKIYTIDGSFIESEVIGEAADSGDKGAGKAQTYAEKVMLLQLLNIPTKDMDPDEHAHEFKKTEKSEPKKTVKMINEDQRHELKLIKDLMEWSDQDMRDFIHHFGYPSSREIPADRFEDVKSALEDLKVNSSTAKS